MHWQIALVTALFFYKKMYLDDMCCCGLVAETGFEPPKPFIKSQLLDFFRRRDMRICEASSWRVTLVTGGVFS